MEALACGTPLVTTDNEGCREYAFDQETALVVPPRDPHAMADAIDQLRSDRGLEAGLSENGLQLVRERFRWEESASRLVELIAATPVRQSGSKPRLRQITGESPLLSVVIVTWDQLAFTQDCVDTIRRNPTCHTS